METSCVRNVQNYITINENSDDMEFEVLIRDLEYDEKLILTLYYCSQYTIKEISKILKINENTIKSKMVRARNKLRKIIEEEEEII